VEYADAGLHKYGHKKPGVRHLVKVFLFIITSSFVPET
jgi:hypothetical protein